MSSSIESLFSGFTLNGLGLTNRIAMSPMTRNFSQGGIPGEDVAAYYRRRAEGGVGLIFTEGVGIDHASAIGAGSMNEHALPVLHGAAAMAGWSRVVEAVHKAGGRIMPQLWHMGPIRRPGTGPRPDAPSARPSGIWGPIEGTPVPPDYAADVSAATAPLSESEIGDIVAGYARSAANAVACGFDGVAIHGAHGYLIDAFFWEGTNRRNDRWGGSLPNRARFGAEVVRAIRAATGPDCPVVFRFSQWKIQNYAARVAQTPQELELLLAPLVDAGVDLFDVSTRVLATPAFEGSDLSLAGWVKKVTGKSAMAVGGVGLDKDLQSSFVETTRMVNNVAPVADRLARGEFDLVAVGRALLVDPEWVRKIRTGEPFRPFSVEAYATLY